MSNTVWRLKQNPRVDIIVRHSVNAVIGEKRIAGLALQNTQTNETETFVLNAVFVGVGQPPATVFLDGCLELNKEGFIMTDNEMRTSVPGVFAAGDVRDTPLRQIITAAADDALAAQSSTEYLRMNPDPVP